MTQNAVRRGIKPGPLAYLSGRLLKMGDRFFRMPFFSGRGKKKKPPSINQGFFRELEFKVFFRTVNQAGFSGIFGCFSDIWIC
jgi:hypothetical protein